MGGSSSPQSSIYEIDTGGGSVEVWGQSRSHREL